MISNITFRYLEKRTFREIIAKLANYNIKVSFDKINRVLNSKKEAFLDIPKESLKRKCDFKIISQKN